MSIIQEIQNRIAIKKYDHSIQKELFNRSLGERQLEEDEWEKLLLKRLTISRSDTKKLNVMKLYTDQIEFNKRFYGITEEKMYG